MANIRIFLTTGLVLFSILQVRAATQADPAEYGLSIRHRVLSQEPLPDGQFGIELELTVTNSGGAGLYDLRIFLVRAGPATQVDDPDPARLTQLDAGTQAVLTWTYVASGAYAAPATAEDAVIRIEAVDTTSQEIRSFTLTSRGN